MVAPFVFGSPLMTVKPLKSLSAVASSSIRQSTQAVSLADLPAISRSRFLEPYGHKSAHTFSCADEAEDAARSVGAAGAPVPGAALG